MSVLDRVPVETRRRTGWVLPMAVGWAIGLFVPDTERVVEQSERFWTSGMIASGFLAGLLWQWYSPRPLAPRLFFPSCAVMAFAVLFLAPGEWSSGGPAFGVWFPIGVVAGLVFMTSMQRDRTGDGVTEERSPST